jgi:oligopeptide/dipeptide ABC transporter ATP-binding protein
MISNNQNQNPPLLKVEDLKVNFFTPHGTARAVDGISFFLSQGESLGIVGESGCGKSVTALSILKLIPQPPGKISAGNILWKGKNLIQYTESQMDDVRGRQISMIFQEPMTSLNPVFTVGFQISEMFRLQMGLRKGQAYEKSIEMLRMVHIPSPEKRIKEYPHELSGGMRQRVMIAMALACHPRLLIADEPTTALDVTIQAQILELMQELKQKLGMALMLITHDLGIVANTVDRIVVMYAGKIVEEGDVYSIFDDPQHPYTRGLLKAVPRMNADEDTAVERLFEIQGTVPSLSRLPQGCNFYPRCTQRKDHCKMEEPHMVAIGPCHSVSCWL